MPLTTPSRPTQFKQSLNQLTSSEAGHIILVVKEFTALPVCVGNCGIRRRSVCVRPPHKTCFRYSLELMMCRRMNDIISRRLEI